jgi:hypothetical protein
MTDTSALVRISFEIPIERLAAIETDDRTPTGLTRYGEKVIANAVCDIAGGEVLVDSVRFDRVEETTSAEPPTEPKPVTTPDLARQALGEKITRRLWSANLTQDNALMVAQGVVGELYSTFPVEPLTAQPEPRNLVLELMPAEMKETIMQTLLSGGLVASLAGPMTNEVVDALLKTTNNWLTEPDRIVERAVAEELDLNAFRGRLRNELHNMGFTLGQGGAIALRTISLLNDGLTPTKRLQGQGLNPGRLETFLVSYLQTNGYGSVAGQLGVALSASILAAEQDGLLS